MMRQITKDEVNQLNWYQVLVTEIQREHDLLVARQSDRSPAFELEKESLQRDIEGWSMTLAKRELPSILRNEIEEKYAVALQRICDLDAKLESCSIDDTRVDNAIDPEKVAKCLSRLAATLANNNAALGNIELSAHIEAIRCYSNGSVVLRCSRLGAMADAMDLLSTPTVNDSEIPSAKRVRKSDTVKPRRLTQRRVVSKEALSDDLKARAVWATDPDRFAGLDDRWFEEITLQKPRRVSWAEAHAPCVATCRKLGFTEERIAAHFKKTLPTIRKALRIAKQTDEALRDAPRRMPRRRWHEDHALEVAKLRQAGKGTNELVSHFGKTDTTIRKALEFARTLENQPISN